MLNFFGLFPRSSSRRYANVFDGSPTEDDVTEPFKLAVDARGDVAYLLGCSSNQRTRVSESLTDIRIDRIDLTLSERTHLTIPNLEDFGEKIIHFYALGTNELVLIDFNSQKQILKQRLIEVFDDGFSVSVRSSYDYTLRIPYPYVYGIKTTVGKRFVVVMTREMIDGPLLAVKLSKRPKKCPDSEREERKQFDGYLNDLTVYLNGRNANLRISSFVAPFFTENDRKLNFFCMDRQTNEIDATKIASVDVVSGKMSFQETVQDTPTSFPFDEYGQKPFVIDCEVAQNGFDHVGLTTKYRTPRGSYRWKMASHLFRLQLMLIRVFFFCTDSILWWIFADIFLWMATTVRRIRDLLVLRPEAKLGMLNTKTWEWKDVSLAVEECHFNEMHVELSQTSGNFVVILSEMNDEDRKVQKVRVVRSPFASLSLAECAQFAIQREDISAIERQRKVFQGHVIRTRKRSLSQQGRRGRHDARVAYSSVAIIAHSIAFIAGISAFIYNVSTFFITRYGLVFMLSLSSVIFAYIPLAAGILALVAVPVNAFAVLFNLDQTRPHTRWKVNSIREFQMPLMIAFVVSVWALFFNFFYWYRFEAHMGYSMLEGMMQYGEDVEIKERVDWLQMQFKCCGVNGPHNYWNKSSISIHQSAHEFFELDEDLPLCYKVHSKACYIPFSCCRREQPSCSGWGDVYRHTNMLPLTMNMTAHYYERGCVQNVQRHFNVFWSLGFLGAFVGSQLVALFFTQLTRTSYFVMAATDAIEDCTVPAWIFPFGKYSPENIAKHTRKCFVRGDDFDIATIEETMPKVMPNPKPKLWSVQIGDSRFAPTPLTIEMKQSEEEAGETMMESVMATTTSQPSILPSNLQTVSVAQDTPAR